MNFSIVNLGCKVNKEESDAFASGLLARGCEETSAGSIPPSGPTTMATRAGSLSSKAEMAGAMASASAAV